MFADAYIKAGKFTKPVIISTRKADGKVECGCGAFILLNNDGWILTVAHILNSFLAFQKDQKDVAEHKKAVEVINGDGNLTDKQKRKKINRLNFNKDHITNHSFWWGANGIQIDEFKFFYEGDIAIGKIKDFKPINGFEYPKFKNPKNIRIGTSLCKLGYPFFGINATFNESKNGFVLAEGTLPLPFFPIEGMFTRNIHVKSETNKTNFEIKFLETSSPGLRGQSGGPIFDKEGVVWAVQSRTQHFPLGFSPSVERNGKKVEENQFLNVGWGVHPELIASFLNEHKVKFKIVD
jgi:hypothetical protein